MVASLGHGQMIVIGDAGLPGFWDVLELVLSEMEAERAIVAVMGTE